MNKGLGALVEALDAAADAYRNAAYAEMHERGSAYAVYDFMRESFSIESKCRKVRRLQNNS